MRPLFRTWLPGPAPPSTSASAPPGIIASLDGDVKDDLLELAFSFESIDRLVLQEFDNPHEVIHDRNRRHNDPPDRLGPISYEQADKDEFRGLVKTHEEDEVLAYLGDQRYIEFWNIVFNAYSRTWGLGSIYAPDTAQTKIREVGNLANELHLVYERPKHHAHLPRYVKNGVRLRLQTLESFLDGCEAIMEQHDRGSRSAYDSYDKKPKLVMFPRRRHIAAGPVHPASSQTERTKVRPMTLGTIGALTTDRSIIAITSLISVLAVALEMATFFGTKPYTKEEFSLPELWNYLQAFLVATLALGIIVLPLQQEILSKHVSRWVNWWALLSLISGALAPAIYYVAGSAWSNLLAAISSICAAFITLQLVQALRKAELADGHSE